MSEFERNRTATVEGPDYYFDKAYSEHNYNLGHNLDYTAAVEEKDIAKSESEKSGQVQQVIKVGCSNAILQCNFCMKSPFIL